jgi:hypothetical protein
LRLCPSYSATAKSRFCRRESFLFFLHLPKTKINGGSAVPVYPPAPLFSGAGWGVQSLTGGAGWKGSKKSAAAAV